MIAYWKKHFVYLILRAVKSDVLVLNEEQMKAVNEAQAQIENGQFLTNEQANKEIDRWLSK